MYTAFIVEDELVVRTGLRENLKWEDAGFTLCGEASDGEIALSLIEELRPDLVITDVRMPFMDGLELSRILRKNLPATKIVIISGYEDFDYVKQAIGLQVIDYLLKPVGSTDLLEVLFKVKGILDSAESERRSRLKQEEILRDSIILMRERFLNDLTTGLVSSAKAIEFARELELNLVHRFFCAAFLELAVKNGNCGIDPYIEYRNGWNIIRELVECSSDLVFFRRTLTESVIVFMSEDSQELESRCSRFAKSLKIETEKNSTVRLLITIGTIEDRVHRIATSLDNALTAARFRYIFGESSIIEYRDVERLSFPAPATKDSISTVVADHLRFSENGDPNTLAAGCLSALRQSTGGPVMFTHGFVSIVLELARFVEELGGSPTEVLGDLAVLDSISSVRGNPEEQKAFLVSLFMAACSYRDEKRSNKYGNVIRHAKDFIGENYANPDISLTVVARHVNVSSSHFSNIFSQETGQTFIQYLTEIRMDNAKRLLRTSHERSSEIAYLVGYKDPHYFSFAFKKNVGESPSDYRKMVDRNN